MDLSQHAHLCPLLCAVLCATPLIERLPREDLHVARRSPARAARFWGLGVWVSMLCIYLFLSNAFLTREPSHSARVGIALGLLALLLLPPLALMLVGIRPRPVGLAGVDGDALLPQNGSDQGASPGRADAVIAPASAPPRLRGQRSAELTVGACLRCSEFWLLFWALAAGAGAALVLVNNLGQLSTSIGSTAGPEVYVALFSVCNAAGRLGMER